MPSLRSAVKNKPQIERYVIRKERKRIIHELYRFNAIIKTYKKPLHPALL
jgi:hypothetical protein